MHGWANSAMHMIASMLINLTYIKVKLLVFLFLLVCCSDQALFQFMVNRVCKYSFPNFSPAWIRVAEVYSRMVFC